MTATLNALTEATKQYEADIKQYRDNERQSAQASGYDSDDESPSVVIQELIENLKSTQPDIAKELTDLNKNLEMGLRKMEKGPDSDWWQIDGILKAILPETREEWKKFMGLGLDHKPTEEAFRMLNNVIEHQDKMSSQYFMGITIAVDASRNLKEAMQKINGLEENLQTKVTQLCGQYEKFSTDFMEAATNASALRDKFDVLKVAIVNHEAVSKKENEHLESPSRTAQDAFGAGKKTLPGSTLGEADGITQNVSRSFSSH